jgi:hypothetical protein
MSAQAMGEYRRHRAFTPGALLTWMMRGTASAFGDSTSARQSGVRWRSGVETQPMTVLSSASTAGITDMIDLEAASGKRPDHS